ncbi:MAG: DUF2341 domain-containing protein [Planctomycetota bacterium]|jgi:hypothetical protein
MTKSMMLRGRGSALVILSAITGAAVTGSAHGQSWYDAAWSSRKEITVDNTKVMATLTDFPLLVSLSADDELKAGARSDGFDILFTDDDGTTKLDHEIEEWDDSNGDLVAWVRIPSLPDTVDKVIYLYYGNSSASDQQNASGVWVNYVGVWHLNEASGSRADSTSSNNDLTEQNTVVSVPGKMAGCIDLEESNSERLFITDAAQTGLDITGNMTMQAWVKPESVPGSITFLDKYAGSNAGYRMRIHSNSWYEYAVYDGSTNEIRSNIPADTGVWRFLVGVYDGSSVIIYTDNIDVDSTSHSGGIDTNSEEFEIGARSNDKFFDGLVDEVRIATVARTPEWVETEWNMMSSPSTFYDVQSVPVNYRSIGTNTGIIYQGDELVIGAETFYIYSRDSTTQVTVQDAAAGAHSGDTYTISRAYNDAQSWETARGGDLVGDDRREVGVCYHDGAFTTGVNIRDNTTDATHYMTLTVAEGQRHDGTASSGARFDGVADDDVIELDDPYTVVEWLEVSNFSGTAVEGISFGSTGPNSLARNLLIHDFSGAKHAVIVGPTATLRNSIIYNGPEGVRITGGSADATIENMTIWNVTDDCVDLDSGNSLTLRNCILLGAGGDDLELDGTVNYLGYTMYSTWSGQDPAGFDGNNQSPPADLENLFYSITATSENLHLEDSGHNAVDTGLDLSSSFSGDIDGETRSAPWDLGADEVTALPLRISSGANQTFTAGDSATAISAITVTDHSQTPTITAADDLRIRIPAAFNMDWDVFDTVATISGSASAKVSTTVSYEDSDKTLVLDVTSDFAASDAITVSDLNFANFSAASSTDYLALDVDNDATADATDDKTIEVEAAAPPPAATGTPIRSWREVEPGDVPAPASSVLISFDDLTTNVSTDSRSSASFAHTIGSCSCCSDSIIVVVCVTRGDQECTAVSYGGQALLLAISEQASTDADNEWVTIWYRTNPLPGTNMVDVTYSSAESPDAVAALSYFGVDQSSPIGAKVGASDTSSSNPVTVTISTTVDGSVVVGGLGQHGDDTYPHDQGIEITTEHWDLVSSGGSSSSDSGYAGGEIATTTTGIYTFEWTGGADDDWAIACVELKPSS